MWTMARFVLTGGSRTQTRIIVHNIKLCCFASFRNVAERTTLTAESWTRGKPCRHKLSERAARRIMSLKSSGPQLSPKWPRPRRCVKYTKANSLVPINKSLLKSSRPVLALALLNCPVHNPPLNLFFLKTNAFPFRALAHSAVAETQAATCPAPLRPHEVVTLTCSGDVTTGWNETTADRTKTTGTWWGLRLQSLQSTRISHLLKWLVLKWKFCLALLELQFTGTK